MLIPFGADWIEASEVVAVTPEVEADYRTAELEHLVLVALRNAAAVRVPQPSREAAVAAANAFAREVNDVVSFDPFGNAGRREEVDRLIRDATADPTP